MQLPDMSKIRKSAEQSGSNARKTVVKSGSAVLVAVSLLAGLAFDSPADIIEDQSNIHYDKAPIVMDIDEYVNTEADDDDEADQEKSSRPGVLARFRQAVLSLPSPVRILIITPLWLLGTGLMTLITFLWNVLFASPLGAFIASFALGLAVLTGLFAVTAKILFPDIPLRDLLSKRNLIMLAASALILSGIYAVAPLFWRQYPALSFLVKLVFGGALIGVLSIRAKALFQSRLTA